MSLNLISLEVSSIIHSLSVLLCLFYVGLIISLIKGWQNIKPYQRTTKKPITKVSILVAARNEEANITNLINDVLAQDYNPDLIELVIVNDHSTDRTADIVVSFANKGVQLINLNEADGVNSYKKKAIQTAIKHTKGDLIITTDADCRMGPNWLNTIVDFYEANGFQLISSPVAYFEEKNNFEKTQTLEFSYLIGLGAAAIGNNHPATCNGANLAYERRAFEKVNGFAGIDDLASGDDELLLHKIMATPGYRIGFLKNEDAIVYTYAQPNLTAFIRQRKRWASKSTRYKNKGVMMLGIGFWLFNLSMLLNGLCAIFLPEDYFWKILLAQFLIKNLVDFFFLILLTSFFKRKQLLVLLPILNVLHVFYIIYIGIMGNAGKYNWKDRMVK